MRHYEEDYDDELWLKSQHYYHGTSSNLVIPSKLLKPSAETGIIREQNLNQVYVTTSFGSAQRYAYKAANKFGGEPIVYEVLPDFDTLVHRIDCEYICDFAEIIGEA